ncbi:MAG TPA: leishmanolysin-related zinc metalloendopeptidase [Gemmatimonadaceae bacterium]|nr:leishmanolysin-related zinc metalloendopeptidase [Gemmatimonadaceae bacterium]
MHSPTRVSRTLLLGFAAIAFLAGCGGGGDATGSVKAVSIVFMGDINQGGVVGQAIVPGPTIQIRDAKGNPLSGIAFTVTVQGGGTLTGTPTKTVSGTTSLGTWTLGPNAGQQSLTVSSTGLNPLTISAGAVAGTPAAASSGGLPTQMAGSVGALAAAQPQIKLLDAFGNPVSNIAVTVQITGGGSVQTPNPITNSGGIASVGAWTLGTTAGTQRVTLSAAGVTSVVYTATVDAGPAVSATASVATTGNGTAGAVAPISPSIKIADAFGNGIAGVHVTATIGANSGTIGNPNPVTDVNGVASAGVWTLGQTQGAQTVTLTASGFPSVVFTVTVGSAVGDFNITVRFVGTVSPVVQSAANQAVTRIQQIITGDLPNQPIAANIEGCISGGGVINETIDDIVVYVNQVSLNSQTTLAIGGVCTPLRQSSPFLPFIGVLSVNSDLLSTITANNAYAVAIMTHELLHVVGFGTLWQPISTWPNNLLSGAGGGNPVFIGPQAKQEYLNLGGSSATGVPVEAGFGQGTALAHWRESSFQNELMTGFAASVGTFMPLSRFTIGSVADLGYTVSFATADPFTLPNGAGQPGTAGVQAPGGAMNDIRPAGVLHDLFGKPLTKLPPAERK